MKKIARNDKGGIYILNSIPETHRKYSKFKSDMNIHFIVSIMLFLIFPFIGSLYFIFMVVNRYMEFEYEFFRDKFLKNAYAKLLKPVVAQEQYSIVGYRVYEDEFQDHVNTLENMEELANKGQRMKNIPHRQVGFDIDTLTRHIAFIGTTGAFIVFTF